jgi:hypothetical protein
VPKYDYFDYRSKDAEKLSDVEREAVILDARAIVDALLRKTKGQHNLRALIIKLLTDEANKDLYAHQREQESRAQQQQDGEPVRSPLPEKGPLSDFTDQRND